MSFSLEFSTLKKNQLSDYIRQPSSEASDSLRTVQHFSELESSFLRLKDSHAKRMQNLERRLDQCICFHRQTEVSMDMSRSRINGDRHSLSLERYEDLLEFNFRQIQWTKTFRTHEHQDLSPRGHQDLSPQGHSRTPVEKLSEEIQRLEEQIKEEEHKNEQQLLSVEESASKETQQLEQTMVALRGETTNNFCLLQQLIDEAGKLFTSQLSLLDGNVQVQIKKLEEMADKQINDIQVEASKLISD